MIVTVLKTSIPKSKPREIKYRNYKTFHPETFNHDLTQGIHDKSVENYAEFEDVFLNVLEKHAPIKTKTVRANDKPFITKQLRKAMMKTARLQKKFWGNKTEENKKVYKKQKNFTNKLNKREKRKFVQNLDFSDPKQNKKFWETVKPFFSDKGNGQENITLIEEEKIISDSQEIASVFNKFFDEAVEKLGNFDNSDVVTEVTGVKDPVEKAIKKYKGHPSVLKIKEIIPRGNKFSFEKITPEIMMEEIKALNPTKSIPVGSIPVKVLQGSATVVCKCLTDIFNNEIIENKTYPSKLKLADITPIHKKLEKVFSKNYRPVSILPLITKIYERIMNKQMSAKIEQFLSPYLCGYRKGFSTEYALVSMIERWKQTLDQGGYAAGVLMDLSKAFDTINHELLIAKLEAYGFDTGALSIISDYLSDRWQRTKISNKYSTWSQLLKGVPQGSILGPIFFNLYLNDFLFFLKNTQVCNLADDSTPYACGLNLDEVLLRLEKDIDICIDWFHRNYMKLNWDKCHFLLSGCSEGNTLLRFGNNFLQESKTEKLLGLTIDNQLKFDTHIDKICKEVGRKISALSRLSYYLTAPQKKLCFNPS